MRRRAVETVVAKTCYPEGHSKENESQGDGEVGGVETRRSLVCQSERARGGDGLSGETG